MSSIVHSAEFLIVRNESGQEIARFPLYAPDTERRLSELLDELAGGSVAASRISEAVKERRAA